MARQISKVYFPRKHLDVLAEYMSKHTSENYLDDDKRDIINESIIIDDMIYHIRHFV